MNNPSTPPPAQTVHRADAARGPTRRLSRFWRTVLRFFGSGFRLLIQPVIAVSLILGFVWIFGWAQRNLDSFNTADQRNSSAAEVGEEVEYVCPMLCVPPTREPGRCPVCGMDLKARKSTGDAKDYYGITISPAARRLSNIRTVAAVRMPATKKVTALGSLSQDETRESILSSYVSGRLDKLLVDYTGAEVREGDPLAVIYSPELYSAQVAFLQARQALQSTGSNNERLQESNRRFYESARKRLLEFGLTDAFVKALEQSGVAKNRIEISSTLSGTVLEKLANEGDYVETGDPLLRLVDLSNVWLMLRLFPEDASRIVLGTKVTVSVRSYPGKSFEGTVTFINPTIDRKSQTVQVRVELSNQAGLLRLGDYATAEIDVDLGMDEKQPVVVPRNAVLINGKNSIAYVETEPGRFEFRQVKIGPAFGENIAIVSGISAQEQVVTNAAFMVDAEFNISGKPSLIDPDKAKPTDEKLAAEAVSQQAEIDKALSKLDEEDRQLVLAQGICPVAEFRLGTMGKPIKMELDGKPVFICCEGCREDVLKDPATFLARVEGYKRSGGSKPKKRKNSRGSAATENSELPKIEPFPQIDSNASSSTKQPTQRSEKGSNSTPDNGFPPPVSQTLPTLDPPNLDPQTSDPSNPGPPTSKPTKVDPTTGKGDKR